MQLLQLCSQEDLDPSLRLSSALFLKNIAFKYWNVRHDSDPFQFNEDDKSVMRQHVLNTVVYSPDLVRAQLSLVLRAMIDDAFPSAWPQFLTEILQFLSSSEYHLVMGALVAFYEISKKFQFKELDERTVFDAQLAQLLPKLQDIMVGLMAAPTPEHLLVQKMVLKIVYRAIEYQLPPLIQDETVFNQWLHILHGIMMISVEPQPDDDRDEWPERPVWKAKKWACQILFKIFDRYGNPNVAPDGCHDFSLHFIENYASLILQLFVSQLSTIATGAYLSPRVKQIMLNYLNTSVEMSKTWQVIKPLVSTIITDFIFPLVCFNDEDQELWEDDPYEYVRRKYDVMEDFSSAETAALMLLHQLAQKRGAQTLDFIMGFCHQILVRELQATPEAQQPRQKDGILNIVGALASILSSRKKFKGSIEDLLATFVFPDFTSPHAFLRARAHRVVQSFAGDGFVSPKNVEVVMTGILTGLRDSEMPVRLESAVAMRTMLKDKTAVEMIRPHIPSIIGCILELLRESDNDDLTGALDEIIEVFGEELESYANNLAQQLASSFIALLDYDPENESETHKAMAAMGVLGTLQTILGLFIDSPVRDSVEEVVYPVLEVILRDGAHDFVEEALGIISICTIKRVSTVMWNSFRLLYQAFKKDCIDFFPEMLEPLFYIVRGGAEIIPDNREILDMLFDMCKTVFELDNRGEDDVWHAAKLAELVILYCVGRIDEYIPAFVGLAISRLLREDEFKTRNLRVMCMNVVISAIYDNPVLLFSTLDKCGVSGGESLGSRFLAMWFSNINTSSFKGLHNRRLGILALCRIIQTPAEHLPAYVAQSWPHLLKVALVLFSLLPEAYKSEQLAQEADDEDDDSDVNDFDEDGEDEELDDQEDADTLDNSEYLAELSQAVKKLKEEGVPAEDDPDAGDMDDSNTRQFKAPLDGEVDEYLLLQETIQGLQASNEVLYSALLSALDETEGTALQGLLVQADQHRAAIRSKELAEQGGYAFANPSVPTSFNFGGSVGAFGKP